MKIYPILISYPFKSEKNIVLYLSSSNVYEYIITDTVKTILYYSLYIIYLTIDKHGVVILIESKNHTHKSNSIFGKLIT